MKLLKEKKKMIKNLLYVKGERKRLNDLSFAEIKKICEDGDASDYFSVGDSKEITLKDGSSATIEILDFYHDCVSEEVKAPITFGFRDLFGTDNDGGHTMNEEWTNKGGWDKCGMRSYLNEEFIKLLPDDLLEIIQTVQKPIANNGDKGKIVLSADKIFIPSEIEVFGKLHFSRKGEGEQYSLFKDWKNRVKRYSDDEYGRWWWLRSPYSGSANSFCVVGSDGSCNYYLASYSYGVSPCFAV